MKILSQYLNLGTGELTDHKKIETVRLYNVLAFSGIIIQLAYFIFQSIIQQEIIGLFNLLFVFWYALVPVFNAQKKHTAAILTANLSFAPMVVIYAIVYQGAPIIEDFLFIGLILTFFSLKRLKHIIGLTTLNFSAYIYIVAARYFNWIPEIPEDFYTYYPLLRTFNLIVVFSTITMVLYFVNRQYNKYEEELRSNAKELKRKTQKVEDLLEEAWKANSTKLKLLKVISHDLRSPFSGLLGLTELMESNYERYTKEEMKEMLRMLSDSSKNTLILIENLVQWSKLHSDGIKIERKNIRINGIIKQNINIYSNMALQKNITIVNEIDDFLIVNADENMLMLILRNLLNNAVKYTSEGGEIRLSATPKRRYINISISDTGIGMSPEQINSILINEENNSGTGTAGEKGSGLGLLLCKEYVEKHNCRMYINSQQNEGTIVTFTMPVAKPEK